MLSRVDPGSVGLDADRLARVATHLARYVDAGRLPGWQVLVARGGGIAFLEQGGLRDVEAGLPVEADTVFRIYSMTKPIVSVALLMLHERGLVQLDDPLARHLPELGELQVFAEGDTDGYRTVPVERPPTVRDLLTHTAGFTYGFLREHPVDALYRRERIAVTHGAGTLTEMVERLGRLPLRFQPGTRWNYSVATDVVGALVERLAGEPLDAWLAREILEPLGMEDTAFQVSDDQLPRFAACYERDGNGLRLQDAPADSPYRRPPDLLSGGGGLVSTAQDYVRFCQMLLGNGALDGHRLLGRKTMELLRMNHLPTGGDLTSMGQPVFSETRYDGIGFGLGFSVLLDPARAQVAGSPGELAWGGMASTAFWVDPHEDLAVVFMTQLLPSSSYPLRRELRTLVHAAIVD
ncbi:MAG: serine hydrolase domain-containing protein [Pseudomonadales bacterium]|jgi:CubicO group peptidase (beta-lactamase class C family)|nr:serine hydrolase domain-containing protein [Pseudomonadales bacterium]